MTSTCSSRTRPTCASSTPPRAGLDLPREKVWVNLDRYGNTSAASIPIALFEAAEAGKLDEGDNVVLVAFGGGLSWAAGVVRWGVEGVCRDPSCRHPIVSQPAAGNA